MPSLPNFIPDQNRFSLAAPPKWFLKKLRDYDDSLVIIPSRQGFYYRLAQRRPTTLAIKLAWDLMGGQDDAAMMASYGVVPVTTMMANPRWDSPLIWSELNDRSAGWRQGMRTVDNRLAEKDRSEAAAIRRKNDTENEARVGDAWRYYKRLSGQRTFIDSTKRKEDPVPPGSTRTAAGLVIPA